MAVRNTTLGIRTIASAAGDGLASGAVHIRIYPRPRNLAESREILRMLEGYGEVVMYKHLKVSILYAPSNLTESALTRDCIRGIKYEPQTPAPNSILAIYHASSSAQKLISDSPFRFKIENKGTGGAYAGSEILKQAKSNHTNDATAQSNGDGSSRPEEEREVIKDEQVHSDEPNQAASDITEEDDDSQVLDGSQDMGATSSQLDHSIGQVLPPKGSLTDPTILPTPVAEKKSNRSSSSSQASQPNGLRFREFQLKISPSHMHHQSYMERQGYYAQFTPDRKTIMAADLEDRVPLAGLFDCHVKKEEVHLRIREDRKRNGVPQPFSIWKLWEERNQVGP